MLTWLRDKAKIFLIIVVVTFGLLIFVDWGSGRDSSEDQGPGTVAMVGETALNAQQFHQYYLDVRNRVLTSMQMTGDPHPEGEVAALHAEIEDAAFEEMINDQLRMEYLADRGWPQLGFEEAEAMVLLQLRLAGYEDPEALLSSYRDDPAYGRMLYQAYDQAQSIMFPADVRLGAVSSFDELEFYLSLNYSELTARYLLFTGEIRIPSEQELETFYEENPALFTDPANAIVRYVTIGVYPSDDDEASSRSSVDSLVLSGAPPDTIIMTREQLQSFSAGSRVDELAVGELSPIFKATSIVTAPGLSAWHVIRTDEIAESSDPETPELDTLTISHWEAPIFPGQASIMETYWDVELAADSLLAQEIPWSDTLLILDWGEVRVDADMEELRGFPRSMLAFALDTLWTDDTGPLMYIPSYMGGYPAFTIARRMEYGTGGLVGLEEARLGGRLILTASSEIQRETSMAQAEAAFDRIASGGYTLGSYAEAESLQLMSTPEFTVGAIRQAASSDADATAGILACDDFADVALVAPPLEVLGPFRIGNNAVLVEITSRSSPPLPSDPMMIAPVYLAIQSETAVSAVWSQLGLLREAMVVEDLREEFYEEAREAAAAAADTTAEE
jgi:hypothetical protein